MAIQHTSLSYQGKKFTLASAIQEAHKLLDVQNYEAAEALAKKILKVQPLTAVAMQIAGIALGEQGKHQEAIEYCEQALQQEPNNPNFKNALANYLTHLQQDQRAEQLYREALAIQPGLPDATYNLGRLLINMDRPLEAEVYLQAALQMAPNASSVYQSLGICAYQAGNYQQAVLWLKLGQALDPEKMDFPFNIGMSLMEVHQHQEAIGYFEQALELDPSNYNILIRLALCHYMLRRYDTAELFVTQYLEHTPSDIQSERMNALMLLAGMYKTRGRHSEAIKLEKSMIEEYPSNDLGFSNLLLNMVYSDEIGQEELFEWCRKFSEFYEKPFLDIEPQHPNTPDPERKLRIGYVSADLFNHSVSYFALPLITRHDKEKFDVYAYAVRDVSSTVRDLYKKDTIWRSMVGAGDARFCQQIKDDQIDILIDLSGHTGGNILRLFGQKLAPVQVTWLGFPFSTGLQRMDYRIVDAIVEPVGTTEHLNTETLVRIPGTFCAYRPAINTPDRLLSGELDVKPTPAKRNGFITFGCCNNIAKVTNYTLQLWSRVLEAVPDAKLLIEAVDTEGETTRKNISERFESNGVPMSRVILSNRAKNKQYSLYHEIDIVLDPFPCNGGTTTCDALFMSVPVVSLSGVRFMSRIGATFLVNIGHPEWVTESPDEYVRIAADLASDVEKLDQIRQNLRTEVENSPMMDEVGFARKVERAYREMWKVWCAKQHGEVYEADFSGQIHQLAHPSTPVLVEIPEELKQLFALEAEQDWENLKQQTSVYLTSHPESLEAGLLYASSMQHLGDTQAALNLLKQLYREYPDSAECASQLGLILLAQGDESAAQACLDEAVKLSSHAGEAYFALANLLISQGRRMGFADPEANQRFNRAINLLQHVLELNLKHQAAWHALGELHLYRNRHREAEIAARQILKIDPNHAGAKVILAKALLRRGSMEQACTQLKEALVQNPNHASAHATLSQLYAMTGNVTLMLKYAKTSIACDPTSQETWHMLLQQVETSGEVSMAEHQTLLREYAQRFTPSYIAPNLNLPIVGKKLRLGLVSSKLHEHPSSAWLLPICNLINKSQFELFFYYSGVNFDNLTSALKNQYADSWQFVRGLTSAHLAQQIKEDSIDILINLSGHDLLSVQGVFAYKPAPVQVTLAGVPIPSGLPQMDYLITDSVMAPEGKLGEAYHEKALMLPGHAPICFRPFADHTERNSMPAFDIQPAPCTQQGYISFVSQCDSMSLTRATLELWAEVLHAIPDSRLLLSNSLIIQEIVPQLEALGIENNRIQVPAEQLDVRERFYQRADIMLDPIPYSDALTTSSALWMGVPVVTLVGESPLSRASASVLTAIGHTDLIAHSAQEYIQIVKKLTQDVERLNTLRHTLRAAMVNSPLREEVSYVRTLEAVLQNVWQIWCESESAAPARQHWQHTEALKLCAELLANGNYAEAVAGYKMVLSEWKECQESLYGLGMCALLTENFEQAASLLERAEISMQHNTHPLRADCLAGLGQAYFGLGRLTEAKMQWLHSLALKESEAVRSWLNALGSEQPILN